MVKYYGRARQRIGSVNTNQIGLKMSGCPSKVGRKGTIDRYISRRSQCNQKYCGPVYYHGVIWSWNAGRCVAKAPRGQSFNSGVGTKVGNPRFACNKTCSTDNGGKPRWYNNKDIIAAVALLNRFIQTVTNNEAFLGFIGDHETVKGDYIYGAPGYDALSDTWAFEPFIGSTYSNTAGADVKAAADLLNGMQIRAWVNGKYMLHEVGVIGTNISDNTPKHGLNLRLADRLIIAVFADTCKGGKCDGKTSTPLPWFGWWTVGGCPNQCGAGTFCEWETNVKESWATFNECACSEC